MEKEEQTEKGTMGMEELESRSIGAVLQEANSVVDTP